MKWKPTLGMKERDPDLAVKCNWTRTSFGVGVGGVKMCEDLKTFGP